MATGHCQESPGSESELFAAHYPWQATLDECDARSQNGTIARDRVLAATGEARGDQEVTQRYQQNSAVETAPLGQGLIVLEPKARKFCALNATSSLIWWRLQEPASPEQLAEHLSESFHGVSKSEALRDVNAIIQEMTSLGIVISVV
jgi:hypothetical protein